MANMFVNGSGRNEHSKEAGENHRPRAEQLVNFITCGCESTAPFLAHLATFQGCFLSNFDSFDKAVSDEKII
jgi:hypothetical protein